MTHPINTIETQAAYMARKGLKRGDRIVGTASAAGAAIESYAQYTARKKAEAEAPPKKTRAKKADDE